MGARPGSGLRRGSGTEKRGPGVEQIADEFDNFRAREGNARVCLGRERFRTIRRHAIVSEVCVSPKAGQCVRVIHR